jgi:hypothetical protein
LQLYSCIIWCISEFCIGDYSQPVVEAQGHEVFIKSWLEKGKVLPVSTLFLYHHLMHLWAFALEIIPSLLFLFILFSYRTWKVRLMFSWRLFCRNNSTSLVILISI